MGNEKEAQRIYFKNLDVLRFLAAYMIVLLHSYFGWTGKFGHDALLSNGLTQERKDKIDMIIHNLSFGVDIFFMISGFLIVYLLLAEREKNGKVDVLKFYIRRAFRIWPLYFIMILVAPLMGYYLHEQSPTYLYHFLFAGNFDLIQNGTKSIATNHLWSICIEEHFYLFCPLLIGLIPLRKLPQVLLGIILLCIVFRGFFAIKTADYGMAIYVHTLCRIDILALGALFGYLFYYKKIQFNHALPTRLIIYTIFIMVFLNISYNESGTFLTDTMKKYLFALPAAYWMGNYLFNPDARFSLQKSGLLNQFGKVSYGIYMFNPIIIFLLTYFFAKYSSQNYILFLFFVHLALGLTTFLSYRFIELPFLALKERYAVVKSGLDLDNVSKIQENETVVQSLEDEDVLVNIIKNKSS